MYQNSAWLPYEFLSDSYTEWFKTYLLMASLIKLKIPASQEDFVSFNVNILLLCLVISDTVWINMPKIK